MGIVVVACVASLTEARLGSSSSSTEVADVVEADVEDFEVGAEAEAFEAEERELQGGWGRGAVGWNNGNGNRGGAVGWDNGNGNRGYAVGWETGGRGNGRQAFRGNGRQAFRGNHGQGGYYESDQRYS